MHRGIEVQFFLCVIWLNIASIVLLHCLLGISNGILSVKNTDSAVHTDFQLT